MSKNSIIPFLKNYLINFLTSPFLLDTNVFNYQLKRLSELLGTHISLSSYSARHSWATIANYQNYQQELISNAMGHSSVKVTETYFKVHSDEQINEMNRGILKYTFQQ